MYFLPKAKLKVGILLKSYAPIANANFAETCFYLSIMLLASNGLYEIFQVGNTDVIGSLGIANYAFKEGREAFVNSQSYNSAYCCNDHRKT